MKSIALSDNQRNYQKIAARIKEKRVPLAVGLELTYDCNLACRHCYVVPDAKMELAPAQYGELIDDLYDLGTFCLVFTGGEPLKRKDFFEIAGYAHRKGFLMVLFTNGTLIDEEAAKRIKECAFWMVEISIYGACADTHDRITQRKGSFEKTLSAVRLLRERGIDINLKTVLLNLNVHEYSAMQELAAKMGLAFRSDLQVNPKLDGNPEPLRYGISDEDIRSVLSRQNGSNPFQCAADEYTDNLTCNGGKQIMSVSPSGDVKPCVIFPVACGNIQNSDIGTIWRAEEGLLADLRRLDISDLDSCPQCQYKSHCVRCQAAACLETGDMRKPPSASCRVARLRYEQNCEREKNYGAS